jgi:membrane-bound lytic murein transglycosylase F
MRGLSDGRRLTGNCSLFGNRYLLFVVAGLASAAVLLGVGALLLVRGSQDREPLERIRKSGTITVITRNTQHAYYLNRGEPAGFEFELAHAFAEHLGVGLEVLVTPWSEMIPTLRAGKGDFIAAALTDTEDRRRRVRFSDPYLIVRQQLIVHASNYDVRSMVDMNGMTVHVRDETSYEQRLRELADGGLQVDIRVHPDTPTEELIRRVAAGEIDATIADTHVARLNRRYYPDAKIALAISGPQPLAWAVRSRDRQLTAEINRFFAKTKIDNGRAEFAQIYEKYYGSTEVFDYVDITVYHERIETRLPRYEEAFREAAARYGFDWRMIAAMAYQESHYHPLATSASGARGLMQITAPTAGELGLDDPHDPRKSIMAGVRYLATLYERLEDIDSRRDRLLIAMAAYNVGFGHVDDARTLARRRGLDPDRWRSLEETLPLLSHPEYYRELPHGYARGREPVRYVNHILTYYDILRRLEPTATDDVRS